MGSKEVSSGVAALDEIIGGFRIGDNVVWHTESGGFIEVFSSSFLKSSRKAGHRMVLVTLNASPKTLIARFGSTANHPDVILVDGFTWGKGEGARLFTGYYDSVYPGCRCKVVKVPAPHRIESFIEVINAIEEDMPEGTRYLFDSLTGMGQIWGGEETVLTFFTRQCPRLFELKTVAYWVLEKSAHSDLFRAQINHITQVAIDCSVREGAPILTVLKAENRESSSILKPRPYQVRRSRIEFLEERRRDPDILIGPRLRAFRLKKGMSQVELARAIGVSPSTISQVEGEQILLSLPALVAAARALDVSLDTLVHANGKDPINPTGSGDERKRIRLGPFNEEQIVAYPLTPWSHLNQLEAYEVRLQPGARLQGHFFVNKGEEFGYLVQGEVQVLLRSTESTMREGDVIHLLRELPERWINLQDIEARLIWVIRR